jgi:predicted ArsR family transcriptional regulator
MPPVAGYHHGHRRPAIRNALAGGPATVREIAARLDLTRSTVAAHLARMYRDHEVRRVDEGRGNTGARWALRQAPYSSAHRGHSDDLRHAR